MIQNEKSGVAAVGKLTVTKTNDQGVIVQQFEVPNLVVSVGKNYIASKMVSDDKQVGEPAFMNYMSIGTSTTSPDATQTKLLLEKARVQIDSQVVDANSVTYTATFPAGVGTASNPGITEAGIFNESGVDAGWMLCRTTFPVVNKGAGDSISITWKVTIS